MSIQVFVYGTLKPGYQPYQTLCCQFPHTTQPAIVYGQLYDLPIGYPVLVPAMSAAPDAHGPRSTPSIVHGCLITFENPEIMTVLDDYEQHDSVEMAQFYPGLPIEQVNYARQMLTTYRPDLHERQMAWAYTMTRDQAQQLQGRLIPSGNWDDWADALRS